MVKMDKQEEFINYEELKVKIKEGFVPSDIKNVFLTEELLLIPLYKKIEINPNLESYNFFPYSDVRIECYCNECKCRRIFCFANSSLARFNMGCGGQVSVGTQLTFNKVFNLK